MKAAKALARLHRCQGLSEPSLPSTLVLYASFIPQLYTYSKTCLKQPLKNRQKEDLKDKW